MRRDGLADQDDARGAVGGRPGGQEIGLGEHMLHAVDHGRLARGLGDVGQALEAQQAGAAMLGKGLQQQGERERRDGGGTGDGGRRDGGGVQRGGRILGRQTGGGGEQPGGVGRGVDRGGGGVQRGEAGEQG